MLDEGLMRGILAAPDDDEPRLVAADWLEENGQDEWATFIRLQIRLARLSGTMCVKKRPDGSYRETEPNEEPEALMPSAPLREWLLHIAAQIVAGGKGPPWDRPGRCHPEWANGLPELLDEGDRWYFERGFVERVACDGNRWLVRAEAITARCPLREVKLLTQPHVVSWGRYHRFACRAAEVVLEPVGLLLSTVIAKLLEREWPKLKFEQGFYAPQHWPTGDAGWSLLQQATDLLCASLGVPAHLLKPPPDA